MPKYMVLAEKWVTYVKEYDFFVSQGGLTAPWGKHWKPITASSIEDARMKGAKKYGGRFPVGLAYDEARAAELRS